LNAIEGVFQGITDLKKYLNTFKHPVMGSTSMNLAYLLGGQEKARELSYRDGKLINVEQQGNVIPDIAEFVIDIRLSSPDLTTEKILNEIEKSAKDNGYEFENVKLRHQLRAWYTDLSDIEDYVELAKEATNKKIIDIEQPGKSGYLDLQMFWETTDRPKAFIFGGGEGARHINQKNT